MKARYPNHEINNANHRCSQTADESFLDWLSRYHDQFGVEGLYSLTASDLEARGGWTLLKKYDNSPSKLVMDVFPHYAWQPWRFQQVPRGYWDNQSHRLQFVNWLSGELGINKESNFEGWYSVTQKQIGEYGGWQLLRKFHNSPALLLKNVYPDYPWQMWRFNQVSSLTWTPENNMHFVKWFEEKEGIATWEDWYNVTATQIERYKGMGLLKKYQNSVARMITSIYPNYPWQTWKFTQLPEGYWNMDNQLSFMKWLKERLGWSNWTDWYRITWDTINQERGGNSLLNYHNNSPSTLVMKVFPQYPWKVWQFGTVPRGYWDNVNNLQNYFADVAQLLGKSHHHWDHTSNHTLLRFKGGSLFHNYGSLANALQVAYPDQEWKAPASLGQKYLYECVQQLCREAGIYPDIKQSYRHPELRFKSTNRPLELDIYIPLLQLALEYQGVQHGKQIYRGNVRRQMERDSEKKYLCQQHGIVLICIHHQWSGLLDDLKATIFHHAPSMYNKYWGIPPNGELISSTARPIKKKPRVHTTFMLPTIYKGNMDPTDWWISEKYDGFRAMWLGSKGHFVTKGGLTIEPPSFFLSQLPVEIDLDGELWMGCGRGENVRSLVYSAQTPGPEIWKEVKFMVFDWKPQNGDPSYEERIKRVHQVFENIPKRICKNVQIVSAIKCTGYEHLHHELTAVLEKGGEGLMLRQPNSSYVAEGRTYSLQKLKQRYIALAVVDSITEVGTMKSGKKYYDVQCISAHNIRFGLRRPPSSSTMSSLLEAFTNGKRPVIAYQFFGYSSTKKPLFATCIQHQADLVWNEVVWYSLVVPDPQSKSTSKKLTCYNCRQPINARVDLRVTASAIMKGEASGSYIPVLLSFHATALCLRDWIYHEKIGKKLNTLPPFANAVALPINKQSLHPKVHKQLEELAEDGIQLKVQSWYPVARRFNENTSRKLITAMNTIGGILLDTKNQSYLNEQENNYISKYVQQTPHGQMICPLWRQSSGGLCGKAGLQRKLAVEEGTKISEEDALRLHTKISQLFPSIIPNAMKIVETNRQRKAVITLAGTEIPLDETAENKTIWDQQVQTSSNQLIAECLGSIWSDLKDEGAFERSGIAWIVRDQLVFEIKANDRAIAEKIIKDCVGMVSSKYKLRVPLDVKIAVLSNK